MICGKGLVVIEEGNSKLSVVLNGYGWQLLRGKGNIIGGGWERLAWAMDSSLQLSSEGARRETMSTSLELGANPCMSRDMLGCW